MAASCKGRSIPVYMERNKRRFILVASVAWTEASHNNEFI